MMRLGAGYETAVASPLPWYAVRVQSKCLTAACDALGGKGFETFLPLYSVRREWSDRVKRVDVPLFPGYLFCRLDVRDRLLPVLTIPGVMGIVCAGKQPVPVAEEEIAAVQAVLRSGLAARPWPFLSVGSKVYVEHGPLSGVEGIITSAGKLHRLVVSVNLLQRSLAVEIDRAWVRPVASSPGGSCRSASHSAAFHG